MPVKPTSRDAITAALIEHGPMSAADLADRLGWTRNRVNTVMTTARNARPGKFFRILRYELQMARRGRETPIYSASPGKDAERPVFDDEYRRQWAQRYYLRHRARILCRVKAARQVVMPPNPWQGLLPIQARPIRATTPRATKEWP